MAPGVLGQRPWCTGCSSVVSSALMVTVLMPLPAADFDPTEAAVTWQALAAAGHDVVFATPSGQPGRADDLMLTGQGLDPWGFVPGLRRLSVVGRVLRADASARAAYATMLEDAAFAAPLHWGAARRSAYDALVLPGGHRARGMRPYLESPEVQQMTIDAFRAEKPVGAICHGVLVAARAVDPVTGRSVLYGRRTTALTWALEHRAWSIARYARFWDSNYYRTYLEERGQRWGHMSVQQEVTRALADPADFADVEKGSPDWRRKTSGRARDTADDQRPAFVVRDGSYVSARWPGDVHTFARTFAAVLAERN
jgi:putative intracellular protease/amidase